MRLLLLAWVDADAVKAAEMAALAALELAVRDRDATAARTRNLSRLLAHMVVEDGLADGDIPMIARCGGTATGQLDGGTRPTLAERRNAMAHGDPFEGLPVPGLIELVRDLIDFAHRHYLAELRGSWPMASASSSSGA